MEMRSRKEVVSTIVLGVMTVSAGMTMIAVAVAEYHQIAHWPDSRMASARRTNVKNASLTVTGHGKHGWDVYTRVDSSTGAQTKSGYTRVG